MATVLKVLAQSAPLAATPTDLYTVDPATQTVVSSIVICNRSGSANSFRVAVRPGGAPLSNEHYNYYDVTLAGNDTFIATIGITLGAGDIITVYATTATLSFSLYGQETT
jgi:hypothetical protein